MAEGAPVPGGGSAAGMCPVSVSDIRTAVPTTPGVEAGMVTLREDGPPYRVLSIVIGQPEARAIHSAWIGAVAKRPSSWDLFVSAVTLLGATVDSAVITAVEDGRHYFAHVELDHGGEKRLLAARPSDAVAIALRAHGAQLLVAEQVFVDLGLGDPVDN